MYKAPCYYICPLLKPFILGVPNLHCVQRTVYSKKLLVVAVMSKDTSVTKRCLYFLRWPFNKIDILTQSCFFRRVSDFKCSEEMFLYLITCDKLVQKLIICVFNKGPHLSYPSSLYL